MMITISFADALVIGLALIMFVLLTISRMFDE